MSDKMNLTDAEMAVLALDAVSGGILWEFTWGQGYGYQEVDGLVVEGDAIYVSGWSTSQGGIASPKRTSALKISPSAISSSRSWSLRASSTRGDWLVGPMNRPLNK